MSNQDKPRMFDLYLGALRSDPIQGCENPTEWNENADYAKPDLRAVDKASYDTLAAKLAKSEEINELAEEMATHPAVFSEAELRNESLKIRRDKFMNALAAYREGK